MNRAHMIQEIARIDGRRVAAVESMFSGMPDKAVVLMYLKMKEEDNV